MSYLSLKVPGPDGNQVEIDAPEGIPTGGLSEDGGNIIRFGIFLLIIASVLLALGFLVWGGFMWMTSRGDKQKLEGARKTIIFAIVGLVLAFLSFGVVTIFGKLFDVNFF